MYNWVTMQYSRKSTEHCKPAITEKNKNYYIFKKYSTVKKKKKEKEISAILHTYKKTKTQVHKHKKT